MMWTGIFRELRLSVRSLLRAPLFTVLAVTLMGVGIGANTAIFSVVYSVLLRPLPYAHPDRLVWVMNRYLPGGRTGAVSKPEFWQYRMDQPAFSSLAGMSMTAGNLTGVPVPVRLQGWSVSPGYFETLGEAPLLGRTFTAQEERPDASPVLVISQSLWQSAFGGDPSVLGQTVVIEDKSYTVVGVMPSEDRDLGSLLFAGHRSDFWVPLVLDPTTFDAKAFGMHGVFVVGRLADGADAERADLGLTQALRRAEQTYAAASDPSRRDVVALPLHDRAAGDTSTVLLLLMSAVGFVLFLTCLNVTNLLVARADARAAELSVRAAIGASRGQLLAHALGEAVVIGLAGGALGLGMATLLRAAPPALLAAGLPALAGAGLDLPVVGFTLLLSLVAGLAAGALPGVRILRGDIFGGLAAGGSRGSGRSGRRFLWRGLVILQVAGAVTLVAGAGLLVRSLGKLRAVDPGYDTANLLMVEVNASQSTYGTPARVRDLYGQLQARIRSLPQVREVSASWQTPLQSGMSDWPLMAQGEEQSDWLSADPNLVSPTYFATLGIKLVAGRSFEPSDFDRPDGVVILSETAARRLWPGGSAIGRSVNVDFGSPVWREVVGVVSDVKGRGLGLEARPQWYVTFGPGPFGRLSTLTLSVRTSMGVERFRAELVDILKNVDPDIPIGAVSSMEDRLSGSLTTARLLSAALSAFGAVALVLGSIGVFGLMAYTVQSRRREIGLRMAIGADRRSVVRMVVAQALALSGVGVGIGLAGAYGAGHLLAGFLFGVAPTDGATLGTVAVLVLVTSVIASFVPAQRAGSLDPMGTLHAD